MHKFAAITFATLTLVACNSTPTTSPTDGTSSPMPSASPAAGTTPKPSGSTGTPPTTGGTASPSLAPASVGTQIAVNGTDYAPVTATKALYGAGANERIAISTGSPLTALSPGKGFALLSLKGKLAAGFKATDVENIDNFEVNIQDASGKNVIYKSTLDGSEMPKVSDLMLDSTTGTLKGKFTGKLAPYGSDGQRIGTDVHTIVFTFETTMPAAQ